jgi:hypothetical protein
VPEAKDKSKDESTVDVTKPDKASDVAEKPAIVPTRTIVTEGASDEKSETAEVDSATTKDLSSPSATRIKIEPISKPEDLKPEANKTPDVQQENDADADDDTADDEESTGRNKLKDASRDEQDLIDRKEAERQANLDKIALAKTYYLPINQVVRRRSKHVAVISMVVIILLGLAWLDVSLDAGLISIPGVKAPTHFFSK